MKTFDSYGLNNLRSFISSPDCDCGCGGKMKVMLDTHDDMFEFCAELLVDHGCPESAIFAYAYDDKMYAIVFDGESEAVDVIEAKEPNMDFFKMIDAELRLCCYGLIIETSPGEWDILED